MNNRLLRFVHASSGQSFTELALTLPVLLFALLGGADFARAYAIQAAVENASRAGAEAYAIKAATTSAAVDARARQELSGNPALQASSATVLVTFPTISGVNYVSVQVRYTFSTSLPWPLVPNTVTVDRTTRLRVFS